MSRKPTVLLIQARDADDPMMGHERRCFSDQTGLSPSCFSALNLVTDPISTSALAGVDAVMVGGSGDYSVAVGGFSWHEPMLELLREVVERDVPTFASCFGHQALAQALGGRVERVPGAAELGTFTIELTSSGRQDPMFQHMPDTFEAQLGHNDSVVDVPEGVEVLARSARCAVQATRVSGRRIVTTQFHPELDRQANLDRYVRYLTAYKPEGTSRQEALERANEHFRPSPYASGLLKAFVARWLSG